AVIGDRDPPTGLLDTAHEKGAELRLIGQDFDTVEEAEGWAYHGRRWVFEHLPEPGIPGHLQRDNAAVALALLEALEPEPVPNRGQIAQALRATRLPGRLDVRCNEIEWVLDVAHN